jgi:hypothetical protein
LLSKKRLSLAHFLRRGAAPGAPTGAIFGVKNAR